MLFSFQYSYLFIKNANIANFADGNTLYAASDNVTSLLEILKSESEEAIKWSETNSVFANPDKFQLTNLQCTCCICTIY